jgi:hypothetical protein
LWLVILLPPFIRGELFISPCPSNLKVKMLSFAGIQLAFVGFQILSAVLAVIVLGSYHRQGQNVLLRVACLSVLLSVLIIFLGHFYLYKSALSEPTFLAQLSDDDGDFLQAFANYNFGSADFVATLQAVLLNYLIICTHNLLSLAIVNSCCQALGWRIFGSRDNSTFRSKFFSGLSLFIPLIPTTLLVSFGCEVRPIFFYFRVVSSQLLVLQAWIVLVSIPGILTGSVLFVKSLRIRTKSIAMSKTTQITFWYMFRLGLAQLMLIIMTVLGTLPVHMSLVSAFIPSSYGTIIFFMYGFGQPARKVYAEIFSFFSKPHSSQHSFATTSSSRFSRRSILADEFAFDRRASPIPIPDFPILTSNSSPRPSSTSSLEIPRRGSAPSGNVANFVNVGIPNRQHHPFMGNIREDFRGESP